MARAPIGGKTFVPHNSPQAGAPAVNVALITPSDTVDLPGGLCRFIQVGGAGLINFIDADGTTVTGFPVVAGRNDVMVKRLKTGGTATNVWAAY